MTRIVQPSSPAPTDWIGRVSAKRAGVSSPRRAPVATSPDLKVTGFARKIEERRLALRQVAGHWPEALIIFAIFALEFAGAVDQAETANATAMAPPLLSLAARQ
ncbi:hypothetical protein [Histidinibacterium aquaticum]|uniref:Uncharacterized protein n=1 Tax=Histidinibacterium aquaticum TaxID=2613962 RepID=A0A5J5GP93_9RHOB|nr:hypothetical protein [Histidinibacterium aquaticum]KAA9009262.1 hypothetical protein F3S47_08400 [Histidinibacterium aquaticum]